MTITMQTQLNLVKAHKQNTKIKILSQTHFTLRLKDEGHPDC